MEADPVPGGRTINSLYVLFDGASGRPLACLDGEVLTARRTAAQSALAARLLARRDAENFLMVGTGNLAQAMVEAHVAARGYSRIALWGRSPDKVQARADALAAAGVTVTVVTDLEAECRRADIISCATTARAPIVRGSWLRPGQHLDLVGSFLPDMCEADDDAIAGARLFVDTRDGVLSEAGEVMHALAAGRIGPKAILAELADLCAGRHPGRSAVDEITLFKSVGIALADLIAAGCVVGAAKATH